MELDQAPNMPVWLCPIEKYQSRNGNRVAPEIVFNLGNSAVKSVKLSDPDFSQNDKRL